MRVCELCGTSPSARDRFCDVCLKDVGFPNVRAATKPEEVARLSSRLRMAKTSATRQGTEAELTRLQQLAVSSTAVFNRSLGSLHTWLFSDSPLFHSFVKQINLGRRPQANIWDEQRISAENTVNPLYSDELVFAVLSPHGGGLAHYGPYTVALDEKLVAHRSTCFEMNPFYFNAKFNVVSGSPAPIGYRCTWSKRPDLAAAKLWEKVQVGMDDVALGDLLMEPRGGAADCDFIEVHIYGPIHRRAIRRVSGPRPSSAPDQVLWQHIRDTLQASGVVVEEQT